MYPNREEYEAHQIKAMEKLNKSQSQAALVQSINEGIKVQSQTRFQRINKRSQNESEANASGANNEAAAVDSMPDPQPSTSTNKTPADSICGRAKKSKPSDDRKSDVPDNKPSNNADGYGDPAEDLELIFKPHPSENDWSFTKFFTDDFKRYLKTSADATSKWLNFELIRLLKTFFVSGPFIVSFLLEKKKLAIIRSD